MRSTILNGKPFRKRSRNEMERGTDPNIGNDPAFVANAVRTLIQFGTVQPAFAAHANTIGALTYLMFALEAKRNPATIVTAPMFIDVVSMSGEQSGTWQDRFAHYFPMSGQRAESRADAINQQLGFDDVMDNPNRTNLPAEDDVEVRADMEHEVTLISEWLSGMMSAEEALFSEAIQACVRREMLVYLWY